MADVKTRWGANKHPHETLVRFVQRNWRHAPDRSRVRFLDIGCGAGANAQYLAEEGFSVTALDEQKGAIEELERRLIRGRDPNGKPDNRLLNLCERVVCDACNWEYPERHYDCVIDNLSLCHVRRPPYLWIYDTLKPGGIFWCATPHDKYCWRGVAEGKDYTRFASQKQLRDLLGNRWKQVKFLDEHYFDEDDNPIYSWIIKAYK